MRVSCFMWLTENVCHHLHSRRCCHHLVSFCDVSKKCYRCSRLVYHSSDGDRTSVLSIMTATRWFELSRCSNRAQTCVLLIMRAALCQFWITFKNTSAWNRILFLMLWKYFGIFWTFCNFCHICNYLQIFLFWGSSQRPLNTAECYTLIWARPCRC
jgi:hypothetical protein